VGGFWNSEVGMRKSDKIEGEKVRKKEGEMLRRWEGGKKLGRLEAGKQEGARVAHLSSLEIET